MAEVFTRHVFAPGELQGLSTVPITSNPDYQPFLKLTSPSAYFRSTPLLLAALSLVLGDKVTICWLRVDAATTLEIGANILDDHIRHVHPTPKDLQVNLVVNIVKEITLNQNLPKAKRYGYGEDLIRRCTFDNDFKYALKCSLFDADVINSPYIKLVHYPPPLTDIPVATSNW